MNAIITGLTADLANQTVKTQRAHDRALEAEQALMENPDDETAINHAWHTAKVAAHQAQFLANASSKRLEAINDAILKRNNKD